jgi:hypothetical protein
LENPLIDVDGINERCDPAVIKDKMSYWDRISWGVRNNPSMSI